MYKPIDDNELANSFKHAAGEKDLATKFWQPLTSFAVNLIINQKYSQAQRYLLGLLHKCQKIDPNLQISNIIS